MTDITDEIRNDHHNLEKGKLEEITGKNPFELFESWMQNALDKKCIEANACVVSTVDNDNQPSSRIVYLKELINNEFVFYTNYHSHKGKDIARNNKISMLFFWPALQQQIRIEGTVEKLDEATSDAYFQSRPKESKIGAWASYQSEKLASREELEKRIEELTEKYPNEVPKPPHWGGFALTPIRIEFWQGRASRLHDRYVFEKASGGWSINRLNP